MSKIVFIEHDKAIQNMMLENLKKEGFEVVLAQDGEEGMNQIKMVKPELVVLDAEVPKKNGMEILEAIRADFDLAFIPVLIISSKKEPGENKKYIDLGACDTVLKSEAKPEILMDKVKKCFSLGGGALEMSKDNETDKTFENSSSIGTTKQKATILIIEDDQFLSELTQTKLVKEGYDTLTALDGESGLQMALEHKPDIILLDILLPGIDGFEVLKQLKSNPDQKVNGIPVLLLSNYGQEGKIQKGMSLGAADYLIKANFTTNEIVNKLKSIMDAKG